eukprot:9500350-Pyramimonas_sp.AAC.3
MIRMYATCKLSAKEFCLMCHWAHAAGTPGADFQQYAVGPNQQTGKYQHHLSNVLPHAPFMFNIDTPVNLNRRPRRTIRITPVAAVFESLDEELRTDQTTLDMLLTEPEDREECVLDLPCYSNHPAVISAISAGKQLPVPLAFYLDGVSYMSSAAGRSDSTLGMWVVNLCSGKRHLLSVTRSSDSCQCGCKGWCTIYPHLLNAKWQFLAMQRGCRPLFRHDNKAWEEGHWLSEPKEFRYTAALIWVKGDWGEHSKSLGLQAWNAVFNPCMMCSMCGADLHSHYDEFGPDVQWPMRIENEYHEACARCEVEVLLERQAHRTELLRVLAFVKGGKGVRGRLAIGSAVVNGVEIREGDRLEPSEYLVDTFQLETTELPVWVTLWRPRLSHDKKVMDPVVHRCPLFTAELSCSPVRSLAIDSLRCFYFGPIMRYVSACMWRTVLKNPWQFGGNLDQVIELGSRRLQGDLLFWQQATDVPPEVRLGALTAKMFGQRKGTGGGAGVIWPRVAAYRCVANGPHNDRIKSGSQKPHHPGSSMSLKAAEVGYMLPFALHTLDMYGGSAFFGPGLVHAGQSLQQVLHQMRQHHCVVPAQSRLAMLSAYATHLRCCSLVGIGFVPKHHLTGHMLLRRDLKPTPPHDDDNDDDLGPPLGRRRRRRRRPA